MRFRVFSFFNIMVTTTITSEEMKGSISITPINDFIVVKLSEPECALGIEEIDELIKLLQSIIEF